MKKTILKEKKASQSDNLLAYAISSSESDLRICMKLNQWLDINLSLDSDYQALIKGEPVFFRRYYFEFDEGIEKFFFFVNNSQGQYLFPELKKVDYILLVQVETDSLSLREKLTELKNDREFTVFYPLEPGSLKSLSKIFL